MPNVNCVGFDCKYSNGKPKFRFWYSDGYTEEVELYDIVHEVARIQQADAFDIYNSKLTQ